MTPFRGGAVLDRAVRRGYRLGALFVAGCGLVIPETSGRLAGVLENLFDTSTHRAALEGWTLI